MCQSLKHSSNTSERERKRKAHLIYSFGDSNNKVYKCVSLKIYVNAAADVVHLIECEMKMFFFLRKPFLH